MRICAIIPMFGFNDMTKKCVDVTLKHAGHEVEILVVDDGSPVPFEMEFGDRPIRWITLPENRGYTYATNQGILWAIHHNFDAVLLLNNDTEPEPDFLKYLVEALEADPEAGVAGSARIIYKDDKPFIENFGIDLISGYQAYTKEDLSREVVNVAWIPVCSALIPINVIHQVGLLDRRMKIYCSDNDFCIRAQQLGYKILLVPKSKVKHFHQTTTTSIKCYDQATLDQKVLLEKLSCHLQRQLLDTYPLSWPEKSWGKLEFFVYTKDKEPGHDKLNQLATA